ARRKTFEAGVERILRHARIARNSIRAGEEDSRRRSWVNARGDVRRHGSEIHLCAAVTGVAPGKRRFAAKAKIQSQPPRDAKVVLSVDTGERVAIVLEFSGALLKCVAVAGTAAIGKDAGKE